ncbi:hypothetical protein [uncultured Sphingomonas sp.]|uniref:hypothetical protein n=1 Tax=uncultured Sphingomonas sp. TaxID=158754 RepID=UPI002616B798|nr:hypothetical protein [uncultured Sphingomonas sp.]
MPSALYNELSDGVQRIEQTFLKFKQKSAGNYTDRQLTMAAAYTLLCHSQIETFLEAWTKQFVDHAETEWKANRATRTMVHICTFHEGRKNMSNPPNDDKWNEEVFKALAKHKSVITGNHGIKEANVCELLSPVGFDTRTIDPILLGDLTAFGRLRGDHAHKSYHVQVQMTFDPFDRRAKVQGLLTLLNALDGQLAAYFATV